MTLGKRILMKVWASNENRKSMGMIRYSSEIENQILGELESKQQYGTAI